MHAQTAPVQLQSFLSIAKVEGAALRVGCGLLLLAAFRIVVLFLVPFDFSGDEAYYWEWGQHPALGYFSKPPGIGWLMSFASAVGLETAPAIRTLAVLFGTGTAWFLFRLGERMYNSRVGVLAAITFVVTPAAGALSAILTIDAPLVFFWVFSIYAFWRFLESNLRSPGWAFALSVGLAGGVLIKQMMLVLYPILVASLALRRDSRHLLKRPFLWISLALSLAALLPPLLWNRAHGWVTIQHTLHHFEGGFSLKALLGRLAGLAGGQIGIITPLLFGFVVIVLWRAVRQWNRLGACEQFLFLLSAPGLLCIAALAFRQKINPNWPAVYYLSAVILVAAWVTKQWDESARRFPKTFRWAVGSALALTLLCYLTLALVATGRLSGAKFSLTDRISGWSALSKEVQDARVAQGGSSLLMITQGHRFLTSELAFYLPGHPRVFRFHSEPIIESQHDFWPGPSVNGQADALIVVQGTVHSLSPLLEKCFSNVTFVREIQQSPDKTYALFRGHNLSSWPHSP
jgi:4-amino-4-deoxy-L-arabinose transferase-like glycosyltransferase